MRVEAVARLLSLGRRYPPFWLYPSWSLIAGLVIGAILGRFDDVGGGVVSFAVYEGGAEAARSFVSLTATALATITTFTLSTTVVSLQLASSQHSPRLIEHYLSDRATHAVFSIFLGSFAFAIATLLNIRLPSESQELGQVPGVSISVLVGLLVASLVALVFFVHRVTTSMRIESILSRMRDRTVEAVEQRRPGGHDDDPDGVPPPPVDGVAIRSRRSGYYTDIDWERVEAFAPDHPCRVWVVVAPGDFVTVGSPVAVVAAPADAGAVDEDTVDEIESWLRFDSERWIEADFSYGVRNLVDIALKALSPGVNDPTTASMAIERIGETMAIAGRSHPERSVHTDAGTDVYVAIREWDDTLRSAVRQIVEYGKRDVAVVAAVLRMLGGLAWADTEIDRRPTIRAIAGQVRTWIGVDVERVPWDQERIDAELALLARALDRDPVAHRWHPL
jgi:uncharacterized membrane protein